MKTNLKRNIYVSLFTSTFMFQLNAAAGGVLAEPLCERGTLFFAVANNCVKDVSALLEAGASVTAVDGMGDTPVQKLFSSWPSFEGAAHFALQFGDSFGRPYTAFEADFRAVEDFMSSSLSIVQAFAMQGVDVRTPPPGAFGDVTINFATPLSRLFVSYADSAKVLNARKASPETKEYESYIKMAEYVVAKKASFIRAIADLIGTDLPGLWDRDPGATTIFANLQQTDRDRLLEAFK